MRHYTDRHIADIGNQSRLCDRRPITFRRHRHYTPQRCCSLHPQAYALQAVSGSRMQTPCNHRHCATQHYTPTNPRTSGNARQYRPCIHRCKSDAVCGQGQCDIHGFRQRVLWTDIALRVQREAHHHDDSDRCRSRPTQVTVRSSRLLRFYGYLAYHLLADLVPVGVLLFNRRGGCDSVGIANRHENRAVGSLRISALTFLLVIVL